MVVYQDTNIAQGHMGDHSLWSSESLWEAEACADKCFEMSGCVGFSYWPSDSAYAGCYPKSSTAGGFAHGSAVGGIFGSGVTSGVLCDGSTVKEVMPNGGETYTKGEYNSEFSLGLDSELAENLP